MFPPEEATWTSFAGGSAVPVAPDSSARSNDLGLRRIAIGEDSRLSGGVDGPRKVCRPQGQGCPSPDRVFRVETRRPTAVSPGHSSTVNRIGWMKILLPT